MPDTTEPTTPTEPDTMGDRGRPAGGHPTDDAIEHWAGTGRLGPIGLDR